MTLLASAWQGDSAPYNQTVSAPGVSGPDQNGFITISPDATAEQSSAAVAAVIGVAE